MKKGFIFVETMVCLAFLGTVLLTVYASFTNVLDNAKVRIMYDDPVYLYRTYFILNFLEENGLNEYINEKFSSQLNNTTYITEFGCSAVGVGLSESISEKAFCEKLFSKNGDWQVNHIFIMPYNVNKVVSCANGADINSGAASNCRRNTSLKNLSIQGVNYLYSLDGYTGSSEEDEILDRTNNMNNIDPARQIYRIVIEFKVAGQEEEYTYYDYCLKNSAACADWNPNDSRYKKTTEIQKYKYYYSSLEIPNGYNQVPINGLYNLKIVYDGNGGSWCGNASSRYTMQPGTSFAYDTLKRTEHFQYLSGQLISSTSGLPDFNNTNAICFTKSDSTDPTDLAALYTTIKGAEWNTKPDGSGVSYSQSDHSITADQIAADVGCDLSVRPCTAVLYVNWVKNQKYNLIFNLQGGSPPAGYTYPTEYWSSEKYNISNPTQVHKDFIGWTGTELTGLTTSLTIPKGSTGDREYTAHWKNTEYNITYNSCGTPSTTGMPTKYTYGTGATINGKPTNGTQVFNGFSYKSTYAFTQIISTTDDGNKTIPCKWCDTCVKPNHGNCSLDATTAGTCKYSATCENGYTALNPNTKNPTCKPNTFTVAYNNNGGNGTIASHQCTYDDVCVLKACTFNKSGFTFNGWLKNNTGAALASGASIKNAVTSGTVTYYAKWCQNCVVPAHGTCSLNASTPGICIYTTSCNTGYTIGNSGKYNPTCTANKFTVAYAANGGTGTTSSHQCTYDAACALKANNFSRSGFTWNGWLKNNTGSALAAGASILNAATSGTVTYYAKWCQNCVVPAHGSCSLNASTPGICKYTTSCNAGYTIGNNGKYNPTCTANKFTVAYNNNGGTGTIASHQCTYNGACTLKSNTFSKSGYTWNGWLKNNTGTALAAGASIQNAATSGTVTYYAKWCQNCVVPAHGSCSLNASTVGTCKYTTGCNTGYTISNNATYHPTCTANKFTVAYNLNGGNGTIASHQCTYDASCNLTNTKPTKAGKVFAGWKKNNTGAILASGANIRNAATSGTVTYYAVWNNPPPTCTLTTSGTRGNYNWYRSNVKVTMTTTNSPTEYGLATTTRSTNRVTTVTVTDDVRVLYYYGYVKNESGESECSVVVQKDTVAPTITEETTCEARDGWHGFTYLEYRDYTSGIEYSIISYGDANNHVENQRDAFGGAFAPHDGFGTGCWSYNGYYPLLCTTFYNTTVYDGAGNTAQKDNTPQWRCLGPNNKQT